MANINAFLPPGATSDFSAPMTDNTNVGQRLANPNTITKHIAEVNQNLDLMKKLEEEFKMIDVDQNGMITVDELIDFFRNEKVIILSIVIFVLFAIGYRLGRGVGEMCG